GRLGGAVPPSVELGYHLCYGSPADQHLIMPKDTAILAEIAAGIFARVPRTVDFLHLPVPQDRDDPAYVAPLAGLASPKSAGVYRRRPHPGDGAGARGRIAAARTVVPSLGAAPECGGGGGDPGRIAGLLESHRRAVLYLTNSLPSRNVSC